MAQKLILLFLAGGLGTLARFGLSGWVQNLWGSTFPVGTFAVNLCGCLLFGFVWSLADERLIISGETRFVILTGFMGAFTTFSTFAFESSNLLRDAEWSRAAWNLLGQNLLGVGGVILGITVGKLL